MGSFYHNGKVMDRRATKDTYEREEEEAERLVRPAPKVKPPRDDKKREDVHEHDPDTDGDPDLKGDPDLSLNYKSVGGSLAERVAEKWVRVKNKELDKGTRVSPETLQEQPGKYEKVEKNEPDPPTGKPRPARKPAKPHLKKDRPPHPPWRDQRPLPPDGPRPARPPKPVKPVPVPKVQEPEKEPKTKPPGWVKKRYKPAAIVGRYLVGKQFDTEDELKAYLDEHKGADEEKHWVKGKEPDDKPKGEPAEKGEPKKPKDEHEVLDGVVPKDKEPSYDRRSPKNVEPIELSPGGEKDEPFELEGPGYERAREKAQQAEKAQAEAAEAKEKADKAQAEAKAEKEKADKAKKDEADKAKAEKETADKAKKDEARLKKGPQPKRRKPSKEELEAMRIDALNTFGLFGGRALLDQNLHPDDYQRVKAQIMARSQVKIPLAQLDEHVEKLKSAGLFQLDASKVGPPKQARDAKGAMVPFDSLPAEDQEEAWAQYRNEIVAASMALKTQAKQSFEAAGVPSGLARVLSDAKLGGDTSPGAVLTTVLQTGRSDGLTPNQRARAMDKIQNPKDKAVAAQYFQGQDYLDVRQQFLGPEADTKITEHLPPRDFTKALREGSAMLAERQKSYAPEHVDTDLGQLFRHRLLRRLEALAPEKAIVVQREVDEMDADDYDKARKGWEKGLKEVSRDLEKREKQRNKIKAKFEAEQAKAQESATYREAPATVKSLEDRWKEEGLSPEDDPDIPPTPVKPPRYDLVRGTTPRWNKQNDDLLAQAQEPEAPKGKEGAPGAEPPKKQASTDQRVAWRVVGRYLAFSTCTGR